MNKFIPDDAVYPAILEKQSCSHSFVPFVDGEEGEEVLDETDILFWCNHLADTFGARYWFICHDQDISESGMAVPPHFHIILHFHTARRFMTIYRDFCEFFPRFKAFKPNDEGKPQMNNRMSVGTFASLNVQLRYLMHLEEPAYKHRYERSLIFTNDEDRLDWAIQNIDPNDLDPKTLESILEQCNGSIRKVIHVLGLPIYNRYRNAIMDITKEMLDEKRHKALDDAYERMKKS